jgi:hypothetical protein
MAGFFDGVEAVHGFATNVILSFVFEEVACGGTNQGVVVNDEDRLSHLPPRIPETKVTVKKLESALGTLPYQTTRFKTIG